MPNCPEQGLHHPNQGRVRESSHNVHWHGCLLSVAPIEAGSDRAPAFPLERQQPPVGGYLTVAFARSRVDASRAGI